MHEIDAGDSLCHGMLDLQPRVDLEEVERRGVARSFDEEFNRPGISVPGRACERDGRVAHPLTQLRCHRR